MSWRVDRHERASTQVLEASHGKSFKRLETFAKSWQVLGCTLAQVWVLLAGNEEALRAEV